MSKFHHMAFRGLTGLSLKFTPVSCLGVLAATSCAWFVGNAIAPTIVQAETARVAIPIAREEDETYQTLLIRAENIARAATQRSFDESILTTDVIVTVLGQNNGAVVPLFKLEVTRQNWRSFPDPQRWTKYYTNANLLLGIDDSPSPAATIAPPAPPTAAPAQPETPEALPELSPEDPFLPGLPPPFPSFPSLE
jgi:hypothetical protein